MFFSIFFCLDCQRFLPQFKTLHRFFRTYASLRQLFKAASKRLLLYSSRNWYVEYSGENQMTEKGKPISTVIDFVTGEQVPDIGAESNRQALERILVNTLGYEKKDVAVDVDIEIGISGEPYRSQIDLVVSVDNGRFMAVKCAAGSLSSREREILAAARLLDTYQIPLSIVSDGKTAIVLDTATGKKIGEGLHMIPAKAQAREIIQSAGLQPLAPDRIEREKLIFRSYDSMNVNVRRNLSSQ
jgi:hypothetical protein